MTDKRPRSTYVHAKTRVEIKPGRICEVNMWTIECIWCSFGWVQIIKFVVVRTEADFNLILQIYCSWGLHNVFSNWTCWVSDEERYGVSGAGPISDFSGTNFCYANRVENSWAISFKSSLSYPWRWVIWVLILWTVVVYLRSLRMYWLDPHMLLFRVRHLFKLRARSQALVWVELER